MKRVVLILISLMLIGGCKTMSEKTDVLVRYPLEGEVVWAYTAGDIDQDPQFIVEYDELKDFCQWFNKETKKKKK